MERLKPQGNAWELRLILIYWTPLRVTLEFQWTKLSEVVVSAASICHQHNNADERVVSDAIISTDRHPVSCSIGSFSML
jgi:hypothetical protein